MERNRDIRAFFTDETENYRTPYEPKPEDIDVEGLGDVTTDTVKDLLTVDKALWKEEVKGIKEFYAKFGDKLPKELESQLATLEANLDK